MRCGHNCLLQFKAANILAIFCGWVLILRDLTEQSPQNQSLKELI